jgi:hypothetical protein
LFCSVGQICHFNKIATEGTRYKQRKKIPHHGSLEDLPFPNKNPLYLQKEIDSVNTKKNRASVKQEGPKKDRMVRISYFGPNVRPSGFDRHPDENTGNGNANQESKDFESLFHKTFEQPVVAAVE